MRTKTSVHTIVLVALGVAGAVAPLPLGAQSPRLADSLLASGALARAESAYYAAARLRPRDPVARWALGRFLVARGAARVGATLLEESLQFGGDPVLVGRELVRAYLQTREFAPLAGLAAASPGQRERARWLAAHEPRIVAPDSVVAAPFVRAEDTTSLANIPIRVNGVALVVSVSPVVRGIVVSRAVLGARHLREFPAGADTSGDAEILAVADSVSIGRLTMLNQPVTVARLPARTQGLIGLAEFGRFAPTVNPKSGRVLLRVDGSLHEEVSGDRLPTLDQASGISVLRSGGWTSSQSDVARVLRNREWTFDAKRGTLIVER
jgi:hypothetical protein